MLSESARMTTAEEARYRIDYPNSKPRAIKVIALDPPSEARGQAAGAGQVAAGDASSRRSNSTARRASGEGWSMKAWLSDLAGRTKDLIDEVASADLVVMVASAGTKPKAAGVIAEACSVRKVMTTALIIGSDSEAPTRNCRRRWRACGRMPRMLVIASNDDYIEEMLVALRA